MICHAIWLGLVTSAAPAPGVSQPNFVIILCDNLGYGDVGCYGSQKHRTPHVDRMAGKGMRLLSFYSTSGVCTPSRASLMTGCYPRRVNLHVDAQGGPVLRPVSPKGLHPEEVTIAELLREKGYATMLIGKWHLGDQPSFLPTRQGFDRFFGIPYSDDMTERPADQDRPAWPPLPLMRGETVVEAPPDRNLLTQRYTSEAIEFIRLHRDRPFFLLLSHAMPGSTSAPFASSRFRGKSANGPWGDSVEEIDWSTGEILRTLDEMDLEERTLVVWTSDNGAPRRNPPQGSNVPLRGWGYTTGEGGQRVPCIVCWPGQIPAATTSNQVTSMMDWLPTLARLAETRKPATQGSQPPRNRPIDGHDIWPILAAEPGARSPYDAFYFYYLEQLQAVRSGPWKLYLPLKDKWTNFRGQAEPSTAELFDLDADVGETRNLADEHPDIVRRLLELAEAARTELGDLGRPGPGQRPAGLVSDPRPVVLPPR